jgi:hypothetical protein
MKPVAEISRRALERQILQRFSGGSVIRCVTSKVCPLVH